jgi:hypothetical protein
VTPGEDAALPTIPPIRDRGADEVGDLARSFAAMQTTLEHVAEQQVETLRKGVAEMFVTLARRNRSLIDRQLALIDELEADEDDPASLADYYRLDHIATRMRRNAESLLVLAGSAPPSTWRTPLGIDDVVRAAIGEIEDYRRVDVLTLEGCDSRERSSPTCPICCRSCWRTPPSSRRRSRAFGCRATSTRRAISSRCRIEESVSHKVAWRS